MGSDKKPRGVLIAGNWKMNHTAAETSAFFAALDELVRKQPLAQPARAGLKAGSLGALIFPPMLSLSKTLELAGKAPFAIEVGAQNVHWEKKGAYTGEVSGPMIAELGLRWALIGHSERRQHFGETDETVRKRAESLLDQGLQAMVCVGETRAEREAGKTSEVLTRQMAGALPQPNQGAARYLDGRLVLAYEPVWAIGTGLTATPEQAQEAHAELRALLGKRFGADAAEQTSILYGGSVTPENIDSLLACPDVDGALVGGASLKPEAFLALIAAAGRALA
jgi:triosephosphate isomerase